MSAAAEKPKPYSPMQTASWAESNLFKARAAAERIDHPRMAKAAQLMAQAQAEVRGYFDDIRGK